MDLMSIATLHYFRNDAIIINRCRLFLQLFSIYDLVLYNKASIHPQIKRCERVTSRTPTNFWVDFKRPPKRYIKIWQHFLTEYIEPILSKLHLHWSKETSPNYTNSFYQSNTNNNIYQQLDHGFLQYMPKRKCTRDNLTCYQTTAHLVFLSQQEVQQLFPIDTDHKPNSIHVLGRTDINSHACTPSCPTNPTQLHEFYKALPSSM